MAILNEIDNLNLYISKKGRDEYVKSIEDRIIKSQNDELIYQFAKQIKGADIKSLQDALLNIKGDPFYVKEFAKNIEGADIEPLQKFVIDSNDEFAICDFAQNVKGANIKLLQKAVIKTGSADAICDFARNVKGADIEQLHKEILKTGSEFYIKKFESEVKLEKPVQENETTPKDNNVNQKDKEEQKINLNEKDMQEQELLNKPKIVTQRYLKDNKKINLLAKSSEYENLEKYGVSFRHLSSNSKVTKVTSPRFLQEIKLEDGSRVRVYAKTAEQVEEIKKALNEENLKLNVADLKKPDLLSNPPREEIEEIEEKDEQLQPNLTEEKPVQNTQIKAEIFKTEKNSVYLEELFRFEKIQPFEGNEEKVNNGYRVVDIPVEGTDQKVEYIVSAELASSFKEKVDSGEIFARPVEKVDTEQKNQDEVEQNTVLPEELLIDDKSEEKEKQNDKEKEKPEEKQKTEQKNKHGKKENKDNLEDDKSKRPDDKNPTPAPTNPPRAKAKKHIARNVLQATFTTFVGIAIAASAIALGFGALVGVGVAAFASYNIGNGFHNANKKVEIAEKKQASQEAVEDSKASLELQSELKKQKELQEQEKLLAIKTENANREANIEKMKANLDKLQKNESKDIDLEKAL